MMSKRHTLGKKIVAILLTIAMVPTLVPSVSWAASPDTGEKAVQEKQVDKVGSSKEEKAESKEDSKEETKAEPKEETKAEPK